MQRREFFSSLASFFSSTKQEHVIRPPYGNDAITFDSVCKACEGSCVSACEEVIIIRGDDGTPRLDFSNSGCTYCDACALACEPNALDVVFKQRIDASVTIDELSCLSWQKTMCFSCKDPCMHNAIDFVGMFRPTIYQEACTACGLCLNVCPTGAIKVG
jgi:ferredoxin-type protein NapF